MQIIRFKFSRGNALRLLSHLDLQRFFFRAFRRAGIPLSYSNGFNPHPKLSFAGALPLGMITDCEYGDVVLEGEMSPETFTMRLNIAMPRDIRILSATVLPVGMPSLAADLVSVKYHLRVFTRELLSVCTVAEVIKEFLEQPTIYIRKKNKKGKEVEVNIRPYIGTMSVNACIPDEVFFDFELKFIDQKSAKPLQVAMAFRDFSHLPLQTDETMLLHKLDCVLDEYDNF